jgi:hypothetical protein
MYLKVNNVKDVDLSSVRLDRCLFEREGACVCVCGCVNIGSGSLKIVSHEIWYIIF